MRRVWQYARRVNGRLPLPELKRLFELNLLEKEIVSKLGLTWFPKPERELRHISNFIFELETFERKEYPIAEYGGLCQRSLMSVTALMLCEDIDKYRSHNDVPINIISDSIERIKHPNGSKCVLSGFDTSVPLPPVEGIANIVGDAGRIIIADNIRSALLWWDLADDMKTRTGREIMKLCGKNDIR